jgi:ABC-type multidrug transport system ATPase subunit
LTLIVVSHDLAALSDLVDRVIVLSEGIVAMDGPTARVLSDVEGLRAACLKPPRPVMLLHALEGAGWPVRTDRIAPRDAAAEIAAAHSRRPSRTPAGEERR